MLSSFVDLLSIFSRKNRQNTSFEEITNSVVNALLSADVNPIAACEIVEKLSKAEQDKSEKAKLNRRENTNWWREILLKSIHKKLGPSFDGIKIVDNMMNIITLYGPHGAGKTTLSGKIAHSLISNGIDPRDIVVTSLDYQRTEGQSQLKTIAQNLKIGFIGSRQSSSAVTMVNGSVAKSIAENKKVLIIDTSGWSPTYNKLAAAIDECVRSWTTANTSIFVLDSMTGKNISWMVKRISRLVQISGLVFTKIDEEVPISAIINARLLTKKPVFYLSTSYDINGLVKFNKIDLVKHFVDSIKIDSENINSQVIQSPESLLKKLEGMLTVQNIAVMSANAQDGKSARIKASIAESFIKKQISILRSMTKEERLDSSIIDQSRILRIAKGAGVSVKDVIALCTKLEGD